MGLEANSPGFCCAKRGLSHVLQTLRAGRIVWGRFVTMVTRAFAFAAKSDPQIVARTVGGGHVPV